MPPEHFFQSENLKEIRIWTIQRKVQELSCDYKSTFECSGLFDLTRRNLHGNIKKHL